MGNVVDIQKCSTNNSLIVISSDNRKDSFIDLHNKNVKNYCDLYQIDYVFYDTNYKNVPVYWSKLFYCKQHLETNNHKYIMWMDTDSMFVNNDISIMNVICTLDPEDKFDIYIATDYLTNTYCSGLFIIKNSKIGRNFINQCIRELKTDCKDSNNKFSLGPLWSGKCYEQGIMNTLLKNEYKDNVCVVPSDLFKNTAFCLKENTFVLHKFGHKKGLDSCFNNI